MTCSDVESTRRQRVLDELAQDRVISFAPVMSSKPAINQLARCKTLAKWVSVWSEPHTSVIGVGLLAYLCLDDKCAPADTREPAQAFYSKASRRLSQRLRVIPPPQSHRAEFGMALSSSLSTCRGAHDTYHAGRLATLALSHAFLTTGPHHRQVALSVIETDEWLTAQDAEGRTYYYHAVTMETSWTDPRVVVEEPAKPERQQLHALHVLPSNVDKDALSQILHSGDAMDEAKTEEAFWAVVNEVDRAEAHDEPLSADVPRMLHKIFDADLQHLLTREQIRTNSNVHAARADGRRERRQLHGLHHGRLRA